MTMKLDKIYKASYLKDLSKPDKNWFYDNGFPRVPWINEPQLKQNISIQI